MGNPNNPAGRLHTLLVRYGELAQESVTVHQTWAAVLELEENDVPQALCHVAALVAQIEAAINRSGGDQEQKEMFDSFARMWAAPMLSTDWHPRQTPGPGSAVVPRQAIAALGGMSAYLSATARQKALSRRRNALASYAKWSTSCCRKSSLTRRSRPPFAQP